MSMVRRVWSGVVLFGMFTYDLVASSVDVAKVVLSPWRRHQPAIVVIPMDVRTEWGVALFAYMVSVTPGSTTLHISDDRRSMYVHLLDAPDPGARIAGIKALYERHILGMEGREVSS